MVRNGNTITFSDDEDFFNFAVSPFDVFRRTDTGILYHDWDFTAAYNQAVEEGVKFLIEDENSLVAKRKCVCFRTVCKPVENVSFAD